jgi:pyruvate/2-oxoglutarate dehydrogenase complex dihydrolipoamide acyltransferase (E2) component
MANTDIQVPDIGDFDEVAVIELLVKVGDTVAVDQSLITVESDKASMEIPSSHAGVVKELKVKLGDKVKQGSVIEQNVHPPKQPRMMFTLNRIISQAGILVAPSWPPFSSA